MIRIGLPNGTMKLVSASTLPDLIEKGATKLNVDKENVKLLLVDGCEIDDDESMNYARDEKLLILFNVDNVVGSNVINDSDQMTTSTSKTSLNVQKRLVVNFASMTMYI